MGDRMRGAKCHFKLVRGASLTRWYLKRDLKVARVSSGGIWGRGVQQREESSRGNSQCKGSKAGEGSSWYDEGTARKPTWLKHSECSEGAVRQKAGDHGTEGLTVHSEASELNLTLGKPLEECEQRGYYMSRLLLEKNGYVENRAGRRRMLRRKTN